jgi:hypothetical protein
MSSLTKSALRLFACFFSLAMIALTLSGETLAAHPVVFTTLALTAFGLSVHLSLRHAVGEVNDGLVARVLLLGRDRAAFVRSAACIGLLVVMAAVLAPSAAVSGHSYWSLLPLVAVVAAILAAMAYAVHLFTADAERALHLLRQRNEAYLGSAAASRASASIPAQSPLTILPFGATQLPPTQTVFGSPR